LVAKRKEHDANRAGRAAEFAAAPRKQQILSRMLVGRDYRIGEKAMLRFVLGVGLVLIAIPALADNRSDCLDSKDHDLRIKGCSAVIQRNPQDVAAYHNRGEAYGLKGDPDRAISDYSKAIELNPNYAPAYDGRGRAYTSKGDYSHAVADVTKAGELSVPAPAVVKTAPPKPKAPVKPPLAAPSKGSAPIVGSWPAWARSTLAN
jgi:tetratricopeptide (TPR) repeat protein